jgi:uncharacterized protein with HEPN domain
MLSSSLELVNHINDECEFILKHTNQITYDQYCINELLLKAIERCLGIIVEAANKIDKEFTSRYPEVEWRKMAATRNIIIHNYTGIDYEVMWEIIKNDIPELEFQIKNIIKENE